MRIAVNTRFLIKGKIEGMGLFTYEVLKRMVEQHPEHEFYFFFDRPFDAAFVFRKNVRPIVLFPPARHPFLFLWWFERSVTKALKKYKIDVFLSPDNFLSLGTNVKTVLVTHDLAYLHFPGHQSFFQEKYYQLFSPRFNKKADHIVSVSRFTKQEIMNHYGISSEKISVACNGCDESFQPISGEEKHLVEKRYANGTPYFFYVGAIHPRKNVHRLIDAFSAFKTKTNASAALLIAGRFAWKAGEVKDAYERSAFQQDVHFLGYVSDKELCKLMAGAIACTYVSLFEGFGIPLLQAMHCEVPIISSNVSSMPEVAGDAAILINPYQREEIADAMHQIWQKEHLRTKLVVNGKRQRQLFSWQRAVDVVYEALVKVNS